jgi:hypothetical protein
MQEGKEVSYTVPTTLQKRPLKVTTNNAYATATYTFKVSVCVTLLSSAAACVYHMS